MSFELPADVKFGLNFLHPFLMWSVFAFTLYAGYLGFKWRKTRTAEGDVKKELLKGRYNQKHYITGSLLFAFMVLGTVGGMAVTYINNGKLFVGPHLLVGLGMTTIIAFSAALSPFMQKGADWARNTHIALNMALLGLFGWQALSGVQILQRIVSNH